MSSVSETLSNEDFDKYNVAYAQLYSKSGQHDASYSHFGSNLIERIFLNSTIVGARILNVGSGPCDIAGNFVRQFANYCSQIVLCEVNPNFIEEYKKSDWYKKYKSKIFLSEGGINDAFTNENNQYDDNSFDFIWCGHVFYHFKMKDIKNILLKLNDLLKNGSSTNNNIMNTSGLCSITIGNDDDIFFQKVFKKLKENYHLSEFIRNALIETKLMQNGVELKHLASFTATKKDFVQLFYLFVETVLYANDDYGTAKELQDTDEMKKVDACINAVLPQLLHATPNVQPNGGQDEYVWKENDITYVFRKTNKMHSKL